MVEGEGYLTTFEGSMDEGEGILSPVEHLKRVNRLIHYHFPSVGRIVTMLE